MTFGQSESYICPWKAVELVAMDLIYQRQSDILNEGELTELRVFLVAPIPSEQQLPYLENYTKFESTVEKQGLGI